MTAGGTNGGGYVGYFGYGSLVNRATHRTGIVDAVPARLLGWQRLWRPRPDMPGFPAALLSVRRLEDSGCDGLLVIDRAENLAAVDAREARYNRVRLRADELRLDAPLVHECPIYVYEADALLPPHPERPRILQSYLDAVLQGFLREHGEAGLRRFFAETEGFDTTLEADRHAPTYPRSVLLAEAEQALFDTLHAAHLGSLAAR